MEIQQQLRRKELQSTGRSAKKQNGIEPKMDSSEQIRQIIMFTRMTSNNTDNSKQSQIDVNDSPNMNQDQMELFLNVRRSRSDQSLIGRLFSQPIEAERPRPLIISIPPPVADNPNSNLTSFKLFRKIKKEKKKNESDYCKNICGYITKKIIRELCSPNYVNHVKTLCAKHKCEYQEIKSFYLPKIEQVTGPSHIPSLLVAEGQQEQKIKEVFKQFFQWFIKCRYLRYLLIEGKMADKKAYIKYKNYMLLAMLKENKNGNLSQHMDEQHGYSSLDQDQQKSVSHSHSQYSEQQVHKKTPKKKMGVKNVKETK